MHIIDNMHIITLNNKCKYNYKKVSNLTKLTITKKSHNTTHYLNIIDNTYTVIRECSATRSNIDKYTLK